MPMTALLRFARRAILVVFVLALGLVLLAAAWTGYVIASHDTVNLPPKHGGLDTELIVGDARPRALIVGFGGGEGGNAWASDHWRAQRERFAAQGFAMLAVGYFGGVQSPAKLDRISLDAIDDAIATAARDPRVDTSCVIAIGGSKGAELALSLAARSPRIRGVVAIVPGDAVFPSLTDAMTTSSWTWRGESLPFMPMPWSATPALIAGDLRAVFTRIRADADAFATAAIPVERIAGPVLFVSATRDEFWPSREMADAMMQRLGAHAFAHAHEHIAIDGGHAAPLDHFDRIEAFLAQALVDCGAQTTREAPAAAALPVTVR
jgi:uncharacterized protein